MNKIRTVKNAVAVTLSVIMSCQLCIGSMSDIINAQPLDLNYVVYSDSATSLKMKNAQINGPVYAGKSFDFYGTQNCQITDTLNCDKISGNVSALAEEDRRADMPDYTSQLTNGVNYKDIYDDDKVIDASGYDISGSVYSKGSLWINRTSFSGRGYIRAKGNIQYDAVNNSDDNELFIYSQNGNITIQGTNVTLNGVIYAPKGKIEINAKNLTVNGSIIAKDVELNGTNLTVNELKNRDISLINFGPQIQFTESEDTYRQNRKITLDISKSTGLGNLDESSLAWTFTADDSSLQECIKIDNKTSDNLVKNLIITKPGTYRVKIDARDRNGENVNYYKSIIVTEDTPAVADFWISSDYAARNEQGIAPIELEDTSYSFDGDSIGSRIWSVLFDSDNDGDFSDETPEVISRGNETKLTYNAPSVGKYQFGLTVAEYYEDTIPELLDDNAYLVSDTSQKDQLQKVVEVGNDAPKSEVGISKAKNVDIVVTVGNSDVADIDTLNKNVEEIKADLESRGFDVRLSTVSTSTLTAQDTFAWDEYDHYDYADSYLATIPKHILYEEDSIRMVGYSWAALRDWLYVDDGFNAQRVLSFDMVRDRTDWHSMEGGGFLFNTSIKEIEKEPAAEGEKPQKQKIMNGYCILLTSGGFKLIQITDLDADIFRNGGISGSLQGAGKVLTSVPVRDVYENYNIKIVTNDKVISVFINGEALIENFVLPDNNTGTGFGPIICHGSHGCSQQSYFTFSNIKMSTVKGDGLGDVLKNYKWRDSAEHIVINFSNESVYDLNDKKAVGEAVKSLAESRSDFIGIGNINSKPQYDLILKSSDGAYLDWYDMQKGNDVLRNYILNKLSDNDYSINGPITTLDEISYDSFYKDNENDPIGNQVWNYDLDASVYENSQRESGVFTSDEPLTTLSATGKYAIKSRIQDDPTKDNESLSGYKKWSDEYDWTSDLVVHSKPQASVKSEIKSTNDADKFLCILSFDAYDTDALSHENRGITKEKYEWKLIDDDKWNEGKVPELIDAQEIYLQKYTVCDEQGEWSTPCVQVIQALKENNSELMSDTEKPDLELTVNNENPGVADTVLISVSAKDNTGIDSVTLSIDGKTVMNYQGSMQYYCDKEGEITVKAQCTDIFGNKSEETKVLKVTDRRDLTAPVIDVDKETGIKVTEDTIEINGSVYDETALSGYKVKYRNENDEEYTDITESTQPVMDNKIASLNIAEDDAQKYEFVIEASDKAGNTAYCTINITVNSETQGEPGVPDISVEDEKETLPPEIPAKQDTPAVIDFKASAQTAEIGSLVTLDISAEDEDGLVSVKIYKDDKLVAEAPSTIRFSESEAKTVTFRVETQDVDGNKTEKTFEIIFEDTADHQAPTAEITSPDDKAEVSGDVSITGSAYDETGLRNYKLEYRKQGTSLYTLISSSLQSRQDAELGIWKTYNLDSGAYDILLTVTDNGGNVTKVTRSYTVKNGSQVSEDKLKEDVISFVKPERGNTSDGSVKIEAQVSNTVAKADYKVICRKSDSDSIPVVIKEGTITNGGLISEEADTSMYDEGKYVISLIVTDTDNNIYKKDTVFTVDHEYKDPPQDMDSTCKITSLEDMQKITEITEVTGELSNDVYNKFKLEISPSGKDDYTVISQGNVQEGKETLLGKLDPTQMQNGYYDVRVTAIGDNNVKYTDTVTVSIEGNMKLGNFSIGFEDMALNINNIPVSVLRTYDSRIRYSDGEFGYGWDLSFTDVSAQASCVAGENWDEQSTGSWITTYYLEQTKNHKVTVDLGNGKKETFDMKLSPSQSKFYPVQYGITAYYESSNKSGSTLRASGISSDNLLYLNGMLYTDDLEVFDPQRYIYTTSDNTEYIIDVNKGLIQIKDAYGVTTSFSERGISSSDGKSIKYTYDQNNRITDISDASGKLVKYEYNVLGDLIAFVNETGDKTSFVYNDHYLTEIKDARGVRISKNVYDDDGRLIKTIDSDGNEITYDHDIDGRQEIITDRNGGVKKYIYDSNGNILSQTDQEGNTTVNTYDKNGNLETVTDPLGYTVRYKYDDAGRLLSTTDALGHTTESSYDSRGKLISVNADGVNALTVTYDNYMDITKTTDANSNEINYTRDKKGRVTSITDEIGSYMNMTYDSQGNVISAVNSAGTAVLFTYDMNGKCTSKEVRFTSDSETRILKHNYVYDESGKVSKIIDSDGNVTSNEYNSIGKLVCETDPQGRQTRYDYDNFGNLIKITYPDSTTELFTYDKEGRNITATDRLSRTVKMDYDKVGNLICKTYADGSQETYSYDKNYNLISETGINGAQTSYEYDKTGKNTAVIDALGHRTEFVYNANSQISQIKDAKGHVTKYEYDLSGNRVKTIYPDQTTTENEYDARNRQTSSTDQYGNKTSYTYDSGDRLTQVCDALGNSTSYTYDEVGNLVSVTDANNNTTHYTYDTYGRAIKVTNALGQTQSKTYDVCGNILTFVDFGGNQTTYTYNTNYQIASETTADGTVYYSYTNDGKLSQVRDNSGTVSYQYDKTDGLSRVTYPNGKYIDYKYDAAGNITSLSTPYGTTTYEYDLLGRMTLVTDRHGNSTAYKYDEVGNCSKVTHADSVTQAYEYDALNRLTSEKITDSSGKVLAQYDYTLGQAGERIKVQEYIVDPSVPEAPVIDNGVLGEVIEQLPDQSSQKQNRTVEYTYDALYRLTGEKITEGSDETQYTYTYDAVSNRTSKTENSKETISKYNELNQLITEGDTTYEYDANGNTVSMTSPEKSAVYSYNAKNKLISAAIDQDGNITKEEYEYDYAGNRTVKKTDSDYTYYLNDINSELTNVTAELNSNGSEKCYYTRGNEIISQERSGNVSFYLSDGHGSVRQLADINGIVTDSYVYDAWGSLISSSGSTANSYMYCGECNDSFTGFYYLRARYMDPSTGRFITQDTYPGTLSDPVTLHKYLYANANPVSNIDPSGKFSLCEVCVTIAIDAVIGGICCGTVSGILNAISQSRQGNANSFEDIMGSFFSGFGQGFVKGAIWGAILGGLGILGQTWIIANVIIMAISFYYFSMALMASIAAFTIDDDPVTGSIYLGLAFLSLLGMGKGMKNIGKIKASQNAITSSSDMVTVTRWGREGLESGDWVMLGGKNWLNYFFTFKWQPGFGNKFAKYSSGESFEVPGNTLTQPSGSIIDGFIKSIFNQWRYFE